MRHSTRNVSDEGGHVTAPRPSPRPRKAQHDPPAGRFGVAAGQPLARARTTSRRIHLPGRQPRAARLEPPLDPSSWTGALITMTALAAVLWVVQFVNAYDDYRLDRFGLQPRDLRGLRGIVTQPFLHASYGHLASNTLPFILIGWVVLMGSVRVWAIVTATVVLLGGILTWLIGPGDTVIVGASGLIFGWLGYLVARGYFSRSIKWIVVAVVVLIFFGTLLFALFPDFNSNVSWQSHVCGFVAGVVAGGVLHPRGRQLRQFRRSAVS